jgi:hypothetical protein
VDRRRTFGIEHCAAVPVGGTIAVGFVLRGSGRERAEPQADAAVGRAVHEDAILWSTQDDAVTPRPRVRGQSETSPATTATDGLGSDLSETTAVEACGWPSDLSLPVAQRCDYATRSSVVDRYNVYPAPYGFHLSCCRNGLVQPLRTELGNLNEPGFGHSAARRWTAHCSRAGRRSSTPTRGRNSPATHLPVGSTRRISSSAWMAAVGL